MTAAARKLHPAIDPGPAWQPPPRRVLVQFCPACGAVAGVYTPAEKVAQRIVVRETCVSCGEAACAEITYTLPATTHVVGCQCSHVMHRRGSGRCMALGCKCKRWRPRWAHR